MLLKKIIINKKLINKMLILSSYTLISEMLINKLVINKILYKMLINKMFTLSKIFLSIKYFKYQIKVLLESKDRPVKMASNKVVDFFLCDRMSVLELVKGSKFLNIKSVRRNDIYQNNQTEQLGIFRYGKDQSRSNHTDSPTLNDVKSL